MDESWKEKPECFGVMPSGKLAEACKDCETEMMARCLLISMREGAPPSSDTAPNMPPLGLIVPGDYILHRLKEWDNPNAAALARNVRGAFKSAGFSEAEAFQLLLALFR